MYTKTALSYVKSVDESIGLEQLKPCVARVLAKSTTTY